MANKKAIETRARHAKHAGGATFVAAGFFENSNDMRALGRAETVVRRSRLRGQRSETPQREVLRPNHLATRENHGARQRVLELSNIPRPIVLGELAQRRRGECARL